MDSAKVFMTGRSQAVRLPKAYRFDADEVQIERRGEVIGAYDMLIAAHALALDATLVTNNEREFRRVKGLRVQNWAI